MLLERGRSKWPGRRNRDWVFLGGDEIDRRPDQPQGFAGRRQFDGGVGGDGKTRSVVDGNVGGDGIEEFGNRRGVEIAGVLPAHLTAVDAAADFAELPFQVRQTAWEISPAPGDRGRSAAEGGVGVFAALGDPGQIVARTIGQEAPAAPPFPAATCGSVRSAGGSAPHGRPGPRGRRFSPAVEIDDEQGRNRTDHGGQGEQRRCAGVWA